MPEAQDQVALPAWLESLRAGERSAAPVNNTPPFSAPNFVEEGSLPSWMRPERGEGSGNTDANPVVSAYPGQGAVAQPGQGITAQSLVDENALPPWLSEGKIAAAQSSPAQPIQASSLVEQEDVPEWMKTLQPQSSTPFSNERRPEPKPVAPSQPLSGMSAHDLIDPQAVPDWMKAQGNQGNASAPRGMAQDMGGQQSAQTTQRNTGQSMPNQMAGFSAASLLDENALPQWLHESGSNARQSNQSAAGGVGNGWGSVPSPSYPAASNTGTYTPMQDNSWSAQVPPQTPMGSPSQQGQGMPASSFIDEDALPPWLRTADQQQGASNGSAYGSQIGSPMGTPMGSQVRQAPIAPRHVDNVRVPNRPRNENGFSDTSESAANVFASMLGVASAAPNYLGQQLSTPQPQPAQSSVPGQGASNYGQDYRVAQGNVAFAGNQQGNPSFNGINAGNNGAPNTPMGGMPQGYSGNAAMPNSLNSANAGSGYAAGQPGWNGNAQQPIAGGQGMGGGMPQMVGVANTNAANVPNAMNNYGAPPSSGQMADQSGDQKGKKRGLFGAFLDWLSR